MIEKYGLFKTESKEKGSTYIYAKLDAETAQGIVEENCGKFSAPWLIRDSSVDGLLSITFFSLESKNIHHLRLCFNGKQWDYAPSNLNAAKAVALQCQNVSKDKLDESGAVLLASFLSEKGYDAVNLIHPPEAQATKNKFYAGYDVSTINTLKPYSA